MFSNHLVHGNSISFGERLAASGTFDMLFRDGMALVEETAAYLDGPGREESRHLTRVVALAYASESMRLTTRLMQIASWLLLQRAVNEGEMTQHEAASDKRRSRSAWQTTQVAKSINDKLPVTLLALIEKGSQLQDRVQRLDAAISEPAVVPASHAAGHPLEQHFAMIRSAFPG